MYITSTYANLKDKEMEMNIGVICVENENNDESLAALTHSLYDIQRLFEIYYTSN